MTLRRGFKAEADRITNTIRGELGLRPVDRLDPHVLINHLDLLYMPLSSLRDLHPEDVHHLMAVDTKAFSGTLMDAGSVRAVVINDGHSPERCANSIAHECSHHILKHEPEEHFGEFGLRRFDKTKELEADWLAGCLLVPTPAVLIVYRRQPNIEACAAHFGVSKQLMQKRYNLSGAKHIVERTNRRRRQAS